MKKFLWVLLICTIFSTGCFADELRQDTDTQYQKQITQTGFRILNANNLEKRIVFYFSPENKVKIKNSQHRKKITLYKGLMPYIDNEDELAAILSTQITLLKDAQHGVFRRMSISFSPRKYEIKADKRAVDYLVNAGYNPIALIIVMNKYKQQPLIFEGNPLNHNGLECMIAVYEHIYEKYPVYLVNNEYIANPYYQDFLLVSKTERKNIRKSKEARIKFHKQKNSKEKI